MEQYQIDQKIRLKKLLKALNVNQSAFADSLSMAQPNINRMVNGKSQVSVELLNRISNVYKLVNLHWLLTGDGAMFFDHLPDNSLQVKEDPVVYGKDKGGALEERLERLEKAFKRLAKDIE